MKEGRKEEPGKGGEGRKGGGRTVKEGRKEGSTEGSTEGSKEGRRESTWKEVQRVAAGSRSEAIRYEIKHQERTEGR